ncbi:hypothetical protein ACIBG0_26555 [Nocardia sp. NPDC050630]|uniref:hypothetical protein n=1 Tax=Nocardia sp. NPDC050630 TaxID=3364321 RepID=UPI0037B4679A
MRAAVPAVHAAEGPRQAMLASQGEQVPARDIVNRESRREQAGRHQHRCPYVAAAVQLKSLQHPASRVARRQKDGLTSFFQHEAEPGGAPHPGLLARQLTLIFDGASARSVVRAHALDGLAVATATTLLDVAGVDNSLPDNGIG